MLFRPQPADNALTGTEVQALDRYALMWSGGKDSALALDRSRRAGRNVSLLISFYDGSTGRVRFHATRIEMLEAQAGAIGLELTAVATAWEEMEGRLHTLLESLAKDGFKGVVFGDIHLADVRAWYESRVTAAGLEHVEPLWGDPPAVLLQEFVDSGGRAVVTCVELAKLDSSWLGRVVDERFATEIGATGIDVCGENGEYHSFAFAGPVFTRPVRWMTGQRRTDAGFVQLDVHSPDVSGR